MEQRTIDDGELRQWIDEWGEESHDDILPSDDEADIANRILEHHTRGEYPDDVDWNDAWESLRSIVGPALEHVHGFFPDGAETLARYVREIDMGIDPDTGEDLERAAIEEPAFRTSFRIRAMADADPEDEPALDKVIQAIENALADHLGDPYGRDDWDGHLEPNVGDHGLFHCGCGWKSSVPDIGEWRRHMADAILAELAEVRERG